MRETRQLTRTIGGGLAAVLMVLSYGGLAACKKQEVARPGTQASDYATPIAPPPAAPAGVEFSALRLGRELASDRSVTSEMESFAAGDTIYASVATTGRGTATAIRARWTFADGQVVADDARTISGTGSDLTEFHITKPDGFPAGGYRVEIFLDGRPAANRNFTVR